MCLSHYTLFLPLILNKSKLMKLITLATALLITFGAFSQSNLNGKVTDEQNQPLMGATVFIPALQIGTTTDLDGNFELTSIKEGTWEVTFRMLGYRTRVEQITFSQDGTIPFTAVLTEDLNSLDEVVISASRNSEYLSEIPASVTVVGEVKLQEFSNSTSNISEILEFTVPGLAVSTGTFSNWGQTLRGRSLLVMVDGIPQSTPLRNGQLGIKSISPNDISRVEVIKGATSIFGNGGNGGFINYITKKPNAAEKIEGTTNVWGTSNLAATDDALGFGLYQSLKGNLGRRSTVPWPSWNTGFPITKISLWAVTYTNRPRTPHSYLFRQSSRSLTRKGTIPSRPGTGSRVLWRDRSPRDRHL